MGKLLYPRLALQNIRRGRQFYLPYFLTVLVTAAAFYMVLALNQPDSWPRRLRYAYLSGFLTLGSFVVAVFAAIFLTYTGRFLAKRRQRELGLYNILGLGKGHIGLILGFEALYLALGGILGGIAAGILLQDALTLLLSALMGQGGVSLAPRPGAMGATALLVGAVLAFNLLLDLGRVHAQRPVELLREGAVGEKEPKARWLVSLLGVATLGGGYAIAVLARSAIDALLFYFLAVLLVIVGTYCLFTNLSIAVMKLLRKNKKYYYQTSHFIGLSNMLYRMKRNAVGLANICILCTMVLVMISGTLCFILGSAELVRGADPDTAAEFYALNGGFFFLGAFLSILFTLATVLIIYYKQLSEGYEDRARYHIMSNVGMEDRDIRRSVNGQVRVVFFAPLLVAAVHVAFDFPLVARLLTLFRIENLPLELLCTAGVLGAFALLYTGVYRLTARVYYRILR